MENQAFHDRLDLRSNSNQWDDGICHGNHDLELANITWQAQVRNAAIHLGIGICKIATSTIGLPSGRRAARVFKLHTSGRVPIHQKLAKTSDISHLLRYANSPAPPEMQ